MEHEGMLDQIACFFLSYLPELRFIIANNDRTVTGISHLMRRLSCFCLNLFV